MGNERILVADLGEEWLKDAEFKAEFDALAEEFAFAAALTTADRCDTKQSEAPPGQENEIHRELGMSHGSR